METMKVDPKKPNDAQSRKDGDGIPVYELRFCVQGGRDVGLDDDAGGRGILRTKQGREITYFPQKRFYRVIDSRKKRPLYIPESWATFEPLE